MHAPSGVRSSSLGYEQQRGNSWSGAGSKPSCQVYSGLKGTRGISEAMAKLGLPSLQQRRKQQRLQLLMKILSREDTHPALIESYDELMRRPNNFIQTRAQYHGHPTSMQTNSNLYYYNFLPKTVRELRESN